MVFGPAGQVGLPLERVTQAGSELVKGMSESAIQHIYQAGQQQAARTITPGVKKMYSQKLDTMQRTQIKMLDAMGKEYGVEFDVVSSISGGSTNAAYAGSGRRIVVALDALEGAYVQAGTHELVHYLKASDSDAYGVVEEMVLNHLKKSELFDADKLIDQRIKSYASQGVTLSREGAMEEIIAEALPSIFADKASIQEMVRSNRSVAEKIRDFITEFVNKIRTIAGRYVEKANRAEIYAMLENREGLSEIARTFDQALRAADEKQRRGEVDNLPSTGIDLQEMTKYSVNEQEVIEGYLEAVDDKILEAAQTYRDDKNAPFKRFKLGDVQAREAEAIKAMTGKDIAGFTHNIDRSGFLHIEKRHGENGEADHSMADLNDVARQGWVLLHYDDIGLLKNSRNEYVYSENYLDAEGKPSPLVVYRKKINGTYYLVEAVTDGKWSKVWTQAAYISNKEINASWMSDASDKTPDFTSGNDSTAASNTSIAESTPDVNSGTKFSLNDVGDVDSLESELERIPVVAQVNNTAVKELARQARNAARNQLNEQTARRTRQLSYRIVKEYSSSYDRATLESNIGKLIDQYSKEGANEETLRAVAGMSKAIIEKSSKQDDSLRGQYAQLRKTMQGTKISLTSEQQAEVESQYGGVAEFKKVLGREVKISDEGMPLDGLWAELSDQYPEIFPADTVTGNMPGKLEEYANLMQPRFVNPYGMDMAGAALELALRIEGDVLSLIGAKSEAQVMYGTNRELKARYKARFEEALKAQKKQDVERFQDIARRLKEAREAGDSKERTRIMAEYRANLKRTDFQEAAAEVEATYKARAKERQERAERAKVLDRVYKRAKALSNMLAKPVKGKRIPSMLQEPVFQVLEALDFNDTRAAQKGNETQKAKDYRYNLELLRKAYEDIWNSQSRGETAAVLDDFTMALSERNVGDIREAIDTLIGGGETFYVRELGLKELKYLESLLNTVNHTINTIGKLWKSDRYANVADLAEASISEMNSRGEQKLQGALGKGRDFLALDMMEPVSYAERLGEAGQEVIRGLMQSENDKFAYMHEANEATAKILDDVKVRSTEIGKWRRHLNQIKLDDEHVLRLNDVQLMGIYLTAKRPQGRLHLLSSGMKINTHTKTGDKAVNVQLTQDDLARIGELLSDKQKALAERMQKYLATDVAKWGNDVTQRLYLYDAFGEETYWPMTSDPNALKRVMVEDDERSLTAITNPGFLQPLKPNATNPLVVMDAVEVFSRHIAEMASFAGQAEALIDTQNWLNYQRIGDDGQYTGGVKRSIERLLGPDGVKYMTTLLQDINGARHGESVAVLNKLASNYKKAAVAGKIRVALQQPTSIVRAMAEINPAYLVTGLVTAKRGTVAEMQQHSALAWWKSNGNYDIGIGRSAEEVLWGKTSVKDVVGEMIETQGGRVDPGKWDDFAWARIWTAVKRETRRLHPELQQGTDEYWQHVTRRFEDIVDRTQVVDTVTHRSALLRSKDGLVKIMTAFQAEPVKTYNMLARAAMDVGRNPKDAKAYLKFARVSGAFMLTAAMTSVATALFDAFKYRDDDDPIWEYLTGGGFWEDFKAQWWKAFKDNANPVKLIPIVSQVYDLAEAKLTGGYSTGTPVMALEGVQDMLDAAGNIYNYLYGGNTKKLTAYGAFSSGLRALSEITGMPFAGALANVEFATNIFAPGLLAKKAEMQTFGDAYAKLYEAIASGDRQTEDKLREQLKSGLYGGTPKTPKEIDKGVSNVLAVSDERILKAWQMRNEGNQTRELVALYKQMQKEGFTDEQIKAAVNSVESRMQSQYNGLIEEAEELSMMGDKKGAQAKMDEAEALRARVKKYGMEFEEAEPKDMDEQLEAKSYSYDHLYASIRNGDIEDVGMVAETMESESDAEDPAKNIRSQVSGEFRAEYISLIESGQTAKAEALARKLAVVGIDADDLAEWVGDERYEDLGAAVKSRNSSEAKEVIGKLREGGKKDSEIASSLTSRYKEEYIQLVVNGQTAKANELAEFLRGLGLVTDTKKENCFRQSKLDDWLEAYYEKLEEEK